MRVLFRVPSFPPGLPSGLPIGPLVLALLAACSSPRVTERGGNQGGRGGAGGFNIGGSGGAGGSSAAGGSTGLPLPGGPAGMVAPCSERCRDFPTEPILEPGTPATAPGMFGGTPTGTGPCLVEPEPGTLFPQQWLRPRIKWTGSTGVHQIILRAAGQEGELVAYTSGSSFTLPKALWTNLAAHTVNQDIEVIVRAAGGGESKSRFQIAPVPAGGSMVFWSVKPEEVGRDVSATDEDYASELRGFSVGEESTVPVLQIRQVQQASAGQEGTRRRVRCIGCHVATPDDGFVAFVDDWPWNLAIAGVKPGVVGQPLPGLTDGGLAALNLPWGGMMAFSRAYWGAGKRLVVLASSLQNYSQRWATDNRAPAKLLWYNLDSAAPLAGMLAEGMQLGEVKREGDPRGAACPTWSHDGTRIVYSSTMGGNLDGALNLGATDLYSVPFNDGRGGTAAALAGAAESTHEEYYPAFSPDDQLVAFTRVPRGQKMYANKDAEIAVVPAAGGMAVRLAANDPPECTKKVSPGVNNHWAKWAPAVGTANGRKYYWLLFSSNRSDIPPVMRRYPDPAGTGDPLVQVTQLYMTGVVVEGAKIQSFPAVYLWNQPTDTLNTTPIWENLVIPRID
jgi:hypothetical protein